MNEQLLHRIDERTNVLNTKINEVKGELHDLRAMIDNKYVSRDEFTPVKNIVYGMVSMLLAAILGAVVHIVIHLP